MVVSLRHRLSARLLVALSDGAVMFSRPREI